MIGIKKIKSETTDRLNKMVKNVNSLETIWKRYIKADYLAYQKNRFESNNARNNTWPVLDSKYQARKIALAHGQVSQKRSILAKSKGQWTRVNRAFQVVEGGKSINVFTGLLKKSLLGDVTSGYREVTTPNSIKVSTVVPYAGYVDKNRSITKYDDQFRLFLKQKIRQAVKL